MILLGLADWEATIIAAIVGGALTLMSAILTIVPHFLPGRVPPVAEEACHKHQLVERVTRIETENARRDERMSNVLRTLDEIKTGVEAIRNERRER